MFDATEIAYFSFRQNNRRAKHICIGIRLEIIRCHHENGSINSSISDVIPVSDNVIDLIPIMLSDACYLNLLYSICVRTNQAKYSFYYFHTIANRKCNVYDFVYWLNRVCRPKYWISFLNIDFIVRQHTLRNYLSVGESLKIDAL